MDHRGALSRSKQRSTATSASSWATPPSHLPIDLSVCTSYYYSSWCFSLLHLLEGAAAVAWGRVPPVSLPRGPATSGAEIGEEGLVGYPGSLGRCAGWTWCWLQV